ncbi:MAG: hypothetical protein C0404_03070 [Verrucomicrobia bacterium]|nr:hypothetical protein [Verrucomicrobiota bacterium]
MAFRGMSPFGSLLAGTIAAHAGVVNALMVSGCCMIAGALLYARQLPKLQSAIHEANREKGS